MQILRLTSSTVVSLELALALVLAAVPSASSAQPAESRSVWEGIYTAEQADRGKAVYGETCARCHGPSLSGAEFAPPLVGEGFMAGWTGMSVGTLLQLVRETMPPDTAQKLTASVALDLVAFILQENAFPTGETAQEPDVDALSVIRIDVEPPPQP